MARLWTVVMIQPAGLGGRPSVPPLERDLERVSNRFFGNVDIAEEADQAGDRTPRLAAEHAADLRGIDRFARDAQSSDSSCRGRTSTGPLQATVA